MWDLKDQIYTTATAACHAITNRQDFVECSPSVSSKTCHKALLGCGLAPGDMSGKDRTGPIKCSMRLCCSQSQQCKATAWNLSIQIPVCLFVFLPHTKPTSYRTEHSDLLPVTSVQYIKHTNSPLPPEPGQLVLAHSQCCHGSDFFHLFFFICISLLLSFFFSNASANRF